MSEKRILINKDFQLIVDSFDSLKYSSFPDWKISIIKNEVDWWDEYRESIQKEEMKRNEKKAAALKIRILDDFANARYNDALLLINESNLLIHADDEIHKLQGYVIDILDTKKKIEEGKIARDFRRVHEGMATLLKLNENDQNAYNEKKFLDEALSFLDGSILHLSSDIGRCENYLEQSASLIQKSPPSYKSVLEEMRDRLLENKKEYERKEKLAEFNHRIKRVLMDDRYDQALVLFEEARLYLREKNEIIFSLQLYNECQVLEQKFKQAVSNHEYSEAFKLLGMLREINPHTKKSKTRIRELKKFQASSEEMKREKGLYRLFARLKEKEENLDQQPEYLKNGFKKIIAETKKRIEVEKNRLLILAKGQKSKKRYIDALESLKKAGRIEFDRGKREQIVSQIERIRFEEGHYKRRKKKILIYCISVVLAILVSWWMIAKVGVGIRKKRVNHLLMEIRPLIEMERFDELKSKVSQIFEEREKLKKIKDVYSNINSHLETTYVKLMGYCLTAGENANYIFEMKKNAEKVKWIFGESSQVSSNKWLKKANNTLKLCREFSESLESKQSGKALTVLGEIKRVNNEYSVPFELLHQVSYINACGHPEVNLGGIKFVLIRGGKFEIGCFDYMESSYLNTAPLVEKSLSSFWISTTEITNGQYNTEGIAKELNSFPKSHINWADARKFARKFGKPYGLDSDLPLEAQWEYAARNGGEEVVYPWGNVIDCSHANYRGCIGEAVPVGSYPANRHGIYDLAGNLREWCRDGYREVAYWDTDFSNPFNSFGEEGRAVRGGSFADSPFVLKNYVRCRKDEVSQDVYTGFRIVLEYLE